MKQKRYIFHSMTIEMVTVLLASIISFPLSDAIGVQLSAVPFVMAGSYVVLKLSYYLCISVSSHVIAFTSAISQKASENSLQAQEDTTVADTLSNANKEDILMKRMELFHYEYQHEQQQYRQRKEKEEDEKLYAILQYTRNTFRRLDFDEEEIFQICECVRYFVTNRQALTSTSMHIKRRTDVTQISLKNFAWNIAYQYNISRDVTAQFVMHTFHEWFANSTIDTIRKNLRTTTGRHKIEIDTNIMSPILHCDKAT